MPQHCQEGIDKTIGQSLNEIAGKYPNNIALIHSERGVKYTYHLFLSEIRRVARGLIKIGIEKADRVGLWAPNIPEWIISQIALAKMGAILVPIDLGAGAEDLRYILEQSECTALITASGPQHAEYIKTLSKIDYKSLLQMVIVIDEESYPEMTSWN